MLYDVIDKIDSDLILNEYLKIEKDIPWSEYPNGKQTGLQYTDGNDPWTDAVGRMKIGQDWNNCLLNPFFKGTLFEEIIKKYKLVRTRLMWLKPYSCYSMHRDDSKRLHVPIVTNDNCFFVFKNEGLISMTTGNVYEVDTTEPHSAMNCSSEWRLHLLGGL